MTNLQTAAAGGALAALQNLRTGLQNVQAALPATGGDPFLRMEKDGSWVYGQENVEVERGSLWAMNILSIKHGYSCWTNYEQEPGKARKKNEKLGENMVPSHLPKPILPTPVQHAGEEWPWRDQVSFMLMCTNGEDKGTQVLYPTTSVGGISAINKLISEIAAQLDKDPNHPVPLIELLSDSYVHKVYGKTYVPILEIRGWAPFADDLANIDAEVEDAKEAVAEAPAPKRRRASSVPATRAEPQPQPQVEQAPTAPAGETPLQKMRRELAEAEAAEAAALAKAQGVEETRAAATEVAAAATTGQVRRRRVA